MLQTLLRKRVVSSLAGLKKYFKESFSCLWLSKIFFGLFFVFLPFQIRTIFYTPSFYQSGFFPFYETFFIYLNDIFLLLAIICYGASYYFDRSFDKKHKKQHFHFGDERITLLLLTFIITLVPVVLSAQDKVFHVLGLLRLIEFFFMYLLVVNEILPFHWIVKILVSSMAFQALIAGYQFFFQHSLGVDFLGEAQVTPETLNIAKVDLGDQKLLRSFGTFSHANVLGGAIFFVIFITLPYLFRKFSRWLPIVILLGLGMVFSFSRSAFLAFALAFMVYICLDLRKIILRFFLLFLSLLLLLLVVFGVEKVFFQRFLFQDTQSTEERLNYVQTSLYMLKDHPLGVGFGAFPLLLPLYQLKPLDPWLYQPVHNVVLLLANEGGLPAAGVFIGLAGLMVYLLFQSLPLYQKDSDTKAYTCALIALWFGLVVLAFFDHYLFTIYQGQVLLYLFIALVSGFVSKSLLPRKNS